ncbi:hypothetical protein K493DRAFT_310601 [Basidiobolus meristosporus CBS 931.73]|uniref:Uncharacterized protein n=1 Tax=Basidiobolus meristosporus CBS 931.73 TaxID=1314790 RepID=A0A1Y1Z7N1_9FUNG|nr:hypothetical protein K493DRAFT_310601 [Basidiobolus meristosporus CBS 931.73]|eukprot:ORY06270.1 hypothetical protein K493DRAFT_310601 [Basidiobolus meristosporus CBS 931.73]
MGVMLFILAVVVGSSLMTLQLWNAKQRATNTSNSYFDSNNIKQFTTPSRSDSHSAQNSHQYHTNSFHAIKTIDVDLVDFDVSHRLEDITPDHRHSSSASRPESILLRDKHPN